MTSAAILPSVGPPPPGLKRPDVPENLRPQVPGSADEAGTRPAVRASGGGEGAVSPPKGYLTGTAQNLGGTAAVSIQVDEGRTPKPPVPAAAPEGETSAKLASELSEEERAHVSELKARDREVRAHEAAHAATGQGYAASPQFEYVRGPDGVQYAVGGHVSIDTSTVADDPEATIEKMRIVKAAALAPARPSGQDRAVAATAEATIRQAEADLSAKRREEAAAATGETDGDGADSANPVSGGISGGLSAQGAGLVREAAVPEDTVTSLLRPLAGGGINLIA